MLVGLGRLRADEARRHGQHAGRHVEKNEIAAIDLGIENRPPFLFGCFVTHGIPPQAPARCRLCSATALVAYISVPPIWKGGKPFPWRTKGRTSMLFSTANRIEVDVESDGPLIQFAATLRSDQVGRGRDRHRLPAAASPMAAATVSLPSDFPSRGQTSSRKFAGAIARACHCPTDSSMCSASARRRGRRSNQPTDARINCRSARRRP